MILDLSTVVYRLPVHSDLPAQDTVAIMVRGVVVGVSKVQYKLYHFPWKLRSTRCRMISSSVKYAELRYLEKGQPASVLQYASTHLPDSTTCQYARVRILAAPWNPADALAILGVYPTPYHQDPLVEATQRRSYENPDASVAGSEGWGQVVESQIPHLPAGTIVVPDRPSMGTYRTYLDSPHWIPLARGHELLESVGATHGATLFQVGGTALRLLSDFGSLRLGDVVVQNAGNSAVGYVSSQIAANLLGLLPVSLVRRGTRSAAQFDTLRDHLLESGRCVAVFAEEDVADDPKGFVEQMRAIGDGNKPKLALNAVGGDSASRLLQILAPEGVLVTYGGTSGHPVSISTSQSIFDAKSVHGFWFSRWMAQRSSKSERKKMMDALVNMVLDGTLEPAPSRAFHLADYKQALEYNLAQSSETIRSKVVFTMD